MYLTRMPLNAARGETRRLVASPYRLHAAVEMCIRDSLASIENAVDFDGMLYQIQGIIPRLKNVDIPLDYYVFASDLYLLQFDVTRDGVLARWAKDYYLYHSASNDAEAQTAAD